MRSAPPSMEGAGAARCAPGGGGAAPRRRALGGLGVTRRPHTRRGALGRLVTARFPTALPNSSITKVRGNSGMNRTANVSHAAQIFRRNDNEPRSPPLLTRQQPPPSSLISRGKGTACAYGGSKRSDPYPVSAGTNREIAGQSASHYAIGQRDERASVCMARPLGTCSAAMGRRCGGPLAHRLCRMRRTRRGRLRRRYAVEVGRVDVVPSTSIANSPRPD